MGRHSYLDESAALRLYQMHLYDKDIAGRLGVSSSAVGAWRRREGLPAWRNLDREQCRLAAQRADQVRAAKRRVCAPCPRESLEAAATHAAELGLTYGQYMEAKRTGEILV